MGSPACEFRRFLLPALAVAVAVGIATFLLLRTQEPLHRATVTAWVDTAAAGASNADTQTRTSWTDSAVALGEDRELLEDAVTAGGQDWAPNELTERITVAKNPSTGLLKVQVEAPTAQAAVRVADEVVVAFDARLRDVAEEATATQLLELQQQATATQSALGRLAADAPTRPGLQEELDSLLRQIADVRRDRPVATLTALGPASASTVSVRLPPLGTAITIALGVLIVAAEALTLLFPRRGASIGLAS